MNHVSEELQYIEQHARVSTQPAHESRFKLLKRFITRLVLHVVAGQNEFNVHVARSIGGLGDHINQQHQKLLHALVTQRDELHARCDMLQRQYEGACASVAAVTKFLHESNQRQDAIVAALHSTDGRLDQLTHRTDVIVESLAANDRALAAANERQDKVVDAVHRADVRADATTVTLRELHDQMKVFASGLADVGRRHDAIVAAVHAADQRIDGLMRSADALLGFAERAQEYATRLDTLQAEMSAADERIRAALARQDELMPQLHQYGQSIKAVERATAALSSLETQCKELTDNYASVQAGVQTVMLQVEKCERDMTDEKGVMRTCVDSTQALARELRTTVEEHLARAHGVHDKLIQTLATVKQADSPQTRGAIMKGILAHTHVSASAYETFEAVQRGPKDAVRERLRKYVPWLQKLPRNHTATLLDLGCGRGEFLDLATEAGVQARGVDSNPHAVQYACAKGLDVTQMDLFDALQSIPAHSLGAITAFHVIEHLPFGAMCYMIELARRALCADGLLIMETPNIFNLQVAASDFYKDPTHVRPVHPVTVDMWLKQCGFSRVYIEFMHPFPAGENLTCSQAVKPEALRKNMQRLNELLYGYRDCAIIATADPLNLPGSSIQPANQLKELR